MENVNEVPANRIEEETFSDWMNCARETVPHAGPGEGETAPYG